MSDQGHGEIWSKVKLNSSQIIVFPQYWLKRSNVLEKTIGVDLFFETTIPETVTTITVYMKVVVWCVFAYTLHLSMHWPYRCTARALDSNRGLSTTCTPANEGHTWITLTEPLPRQY